MSTVRVGPTGSDVVVDLDVCVKTGLPTRGTVTLRGSTTPPWVAVLLLLTVVGYLFARAMTSRRFRVTVPFTHAVYDRWQRGRRLAWGLGLVGVAPLVLASATNSAHVGLWAGLAAVVVVVAVAAGIVDGRRHGIAIVATRDDDLLVTRVHPAFAAAVRGAVVEPLVR